MQITTSIDANQFARSFSLEKHNVFQTYTKKFLGIGAEQ